MQNPYWTCGGYWQGNYTIGSNMISDSYFIDIYIEQLNNELKKKTFGTDMIY